ncbi:A disintegrin and metalloproteinase with thrombospondin motifs 5-like [Venturia canescens]|uniref:A disintegrin and metalloproteinase with thrombospondin motifs 5-like n=1 Tax=Venturia canescens TaxID=32260 RepID=UPI001C9C7683|nr:A disintegrin and metalloproteinase with thrombospondin motifs 5-like [Venturia canescens]
MTVIWGIFFLGLVEIMVDPAGAFLSNIHEQMSSAEIFETFGTAADSIPDYEVFPITLPELRRRRNADNEIKMSLTLNGTKVALKFKPSGGYLASKYTPVLSAITDEKAYHGIRYEPLPNALTDIGEFGMYHDHANQAAIVVYMDPKVGPEFEGVVGPNFAIKSLPKRLKTEQLQIGVVHTPKYKRSIEDVNADETSYFAVFKVESPSKYVKRGIADDPMELYRVKRRLGQRRKELPTVVYPEILLILDHNAIRNRSITQTLRFILAFWNAADMVYAELTQPKVRLNIAGIIIGADDTATPYISEDASENFIPNVNDILNRTGTYFYNEQVRFPFKHYDIVMGMTTANLCAEKTDPCQGVLGVAVLNAACRQETQRPRQHKAIRSTGVLHYKWNYAGVTTAVHEAAHLFGVHHDEGYEYGGRNECDMEEGYAMTPAAQLTQHGFKWSKCSKRYFQEYFRSRESECLDNVPLWARTKGEVLPGRWLTLAGQCRNSGMESGCKVPNLPFCFVKGCKAANSEECVADAWQTLPGTECGEGKICDANRACVKERKD